jgi:hypothetical protein
MKSKPIRKQKTYDIIRSLLAEVPGQSVKELAEKIGDNRKYYSAVRKIG